MPFIEKIADLLPSWKAELLNKAGRRILVQHVLTSMTIYTAMAIDFPKWALNAIDKIRRGFLWRGRKDAKGGHCMVAWEKVCRPLHMGGLGISNLTKLCWALRMRWLWLQKTEPGRSWFGLSIQIMAKARAFFSMVLIFEVGDGANTLFWTDKWLHGERISESAPRLFGIIPNSAFGCWNLDSEFRIGIDKPEFWCLDGHSIWNWKSTKFQPVFNSTHASTLQFRPSTL